MILQGKIVEAQPQSAGSRKRRVIRVDQHVIQIAMNHARDRVTNPGIKESRKKIPYYYRITYEYAKKCMAEGMLQVDGVMCHHCAEVIMEGSDALSMAKNNGRKYFHTWCAHELHLL
jgi:hypothetical protein